VVAIWSMYTSHRLSFRRCAVWLVSYAVVREPRKAKILVLAIGAVNGDARELREQIADGRVGRRERDQGGERFAVRRCRCAIGPRRTIVGCHETVVETATARVAVTRRSWRGAGRRARAA